MPTGLHPTANGSDAGFQLRDRSPHPYLRRSQTLDHNTLSAETHERSDLDTLGSSGYDTPNRKGRRQSQHGTASESGTEADDERPHFLKALPPPALKPRKGLKQVDGIVSPLLTPSQLDIEGRKLSRSYFDQSGSSNQAQSLVEKELEEQRRKFETKRRAERIRRVSEGALVGVIGLVVGWSPLIGSSAWKWHTGRGHDTQVLISNAKRQQLHCSVKRSLL